MYKRIIILSAGILFFINLHTKPITKNIMTASDNPDLCKIDDYGTELVSQEDAVFIRAVQKEMDMDEWNIELRYVRVHEELANRVFAVSGQGKKCIFIDKNYFATLSAPIKRFLIGHELAHIFFNHMETYLTIEADVNKSTSVNALVPFDPFYVSVIKEQDLSVIKKHILARKSRNMERQADAYAVKKLNCYEAALEYFQSSLDDECSSEKDPFSSHPTFVERIAQVKNLYSKFNNPSTFQA